LEETRSTHPDSGIVGLKNWADQSHQKLLITKSVIFKQEKQEMERMQSESGIVAQRGRRPMLGVLSFVAAMLALFSFIMISLTSLLPGFNPPGWIRIGTMVPLPLALIFSVGLAAAALARKSGRGWAIGGLAFSALIIAGFVVLLYLAG
jgi:hypothetical protein